MHVCYGFRMFSLPWQNICFSQATAVSLSRWQAATLLASASRLSLNLVALHQSQCILFGLICVSIICLVLHAGGNIPMTKHAAGMTVIKHTNAGFCSCVVALLAATLQYLLAAHHGSLHATCMHASCDYRWYAATFAFVYLPVCLTNTYTCSHADTHTHT